MGKNNKARRAAKARQRARRGPAQGGKAGSRPYDAGSAGPFGTPGSRRPEPKPPVEQQIAELRRTLLEGAAAPGSRVRARSEQLASYPAAPVDALAERLLLDVVDVLGPTAGSPRSCAGRPAARRRPSAAGSPSSRSWSTTTAGRASRSHTAVPLGAPARAGAGHPMLDRIRKLLAKAEATDFEEEAAAFTAKAQELMTRHAIDDALLERPDDQDLPRMVRIPVDPPYVDAKSVLLGAVAAANRCRAIQLKSLEMCSVVGRADDLAVVELLFTSLLVQAQNALAAAARGTAAGRHARSQSFRSSFFLAFGGRIGERLRTARDQVLAADEGSAALPVLRAREHAVEELVADHYGGRLTSSSVRGGYDGAGLAYGRQAADRARLDAGAISR